MYFIIKSSDVNNGIINLNKQMENVYLLHSFSFTNDIYNIDSNNYILPYQESSININIQLTEQYVNGDDLATHLQSKINAVSSGTASVAFNANTGKFTITNSVNFKFNFASYGNGTCYDLIGFNNIDTSYATTATSDYSANLVPYQSLFIDIKNDKLKLVSDENYNNYSFIINQSSNFGDICNYISNINDTDPQLIDIDTTKRIEVKFYDQNNNLITLNNWCLILKK